MKSLHSKLVTGLSKTFKQNVMRLPSVIINSIDIFPPGNMAAKKKYEGNPLY